MNGCDSDDVMLNLALAMARGSDAHIEALFVMRDPAELLAYSGWEADASGIQQIADALRREATVQAVEARQRFDRWRVANDLTSATRPSRAKQVTVAFRQRTGVPRDEIRAAGGMADLIVQAGPFQSAAPTPELAIETALFETGRPVLIASKALPKVLFDTAVIAWNGSAEANRAVSSAMPILGRYKQLFVFCHAEHGRPVADSDGLVGYFAWHGLRAEKLRIFREHDSVGADVLAAAGRIGAGLLVMGAYTHARMREMVFGGATHHVLKHAELPVLFAH
jgi:nucleotide-binding universal stress UspA family protein